MRILIADRDLIARLMLSSTLEKLGHAVTAVSSAQEAIQFLASQESVSLAILDRETAGIEGLSMYRDLKNQLGDAVYMILLTLADPDDGMVSELNSIADDILVKPITEPELRSHLRLASRMIGLKGQLEAQRILLKAATCDDLTGLWNRRTILDQLTRELNRMKHERKSLAVAMADIDRFKLVNDTYGHPVGDAVLRDTAAALRLPLRNYDFIGRYGGEEFLVLLPGCDTKAGAEIAKRLCLNVANNPTHYHHVKVPVTISIGLSSTEDVGFDPAALIAAADAALYRAKAGGRNAVDTDTTA